MQNNSFRFSRVCVKQQAYPRFSDPKLSRSDFKPSFSNVDLQVSDVWVRIQDVVTRTFISAEDHINTQMAVNKLHRLLRTKNINPQNSNTSLMLHPSGTTTALKSGDWKIPNNQV